MKEDSDHTYYDYSNYVELRPSSMKILTEKERSKLLCISFTLEKEYNVPCEMHESSPSFESFFELTEFKKQREETCGRCAHRALVFKLWSLMNTKSVVTAWAQDRSATPTARRA